MTINLYWELLFVWCLLMSLDIASGYIKACKYNAVTSRIMRSGIYRKLLDTFAILAILLMQSVASYLGISAPIGPTLVGAFCFKELTSILENAAGEKGALPGAVKRWVSQLKKVLD